MKEKYATKPLRCSRCKGTGLEEIEGRTIDCIMCQGRGMRQVTMSKEEWSEIPNEQLQRL